MFTGPRRCHALSRGMRVILPFIFWSVETPVLDHPLQAATQIISPFITLNVATIYIYIYIYIYIICIYIYIYIYI